MKYWCLFLLGVSEVDVHYRGTLCPFRSMSFFVGETQVVSTFDKSTLNEKKRSGETQEEEERKKLYIVSTRCLMSTDGVCLHE